jgi:glycosyltransferase involved in cell wall biosynthesis
VRKFNKKQPLATILINSYNYGSFVGRAIESVLSQTFPASEIEILVVDDGSTDDTRSVVASFGDRVIYHYKKNGGQASALNAGFALASGRYVMLLDADDYFYPRKVEKVVEIFERDAKIGVAYNNFDIMDECGILLKSNVCYCWMEGDIKERALLGYWPGVPTSGISIRSEVLADLSIPEAHFKVSADYFLDAILPLMGHVGSVREPLHAYVIHTSNLYSTQLTLERRFRLHRIQIDEIYKFIKDRFGEDAYYLIQEIQCSRYAADFAGIVRAYLKGLSYIQKTKICKKMGYAAKITAYAFLPDSFYRLVVNAREMVRNA